MVGPVKKTPDSNVERRAPPYSVEAEMAVLGGVILHNEALDQVRDLLEIEDFYQPAHQRLFRACCALYDRNDRIDPITLRNELKTMGLLEEAGGAAYLERLQDEVHTTANIEQYARIVAEKALLRRMLGATHEIQGMIFDGRADDGTPLEAEQIVDHSQQLVFEVARDKVRSPYESLEQVIHQSTEYLSARMGSPDSLAGYTTGFHDLDEKTNGLKAGELIIVAARPGMGKTSLALNIGINLARHDNVPVLMFSLEMSAVQIGLRILCSQSGVPAHRVMKAQLAETDTKQITDAASRLFDTKFFLDDSGGVNINTIRSKARRLKAEQGDIGLIIIDYIQMIRSTRAYDSREREIADLSRHLKLLSKELSCPVMALSQLNRQLESREDKRPRPSDLRESGALEQDADVILFLYRDAVYNDNPEEPNKTELIIAKQRSGPTGVVPLSFREEITRFDSYEKRPMN